MEFLVQLTRTVIYKNQNQTTHHNPFIELGMDNNTTIENDDTSETSNGGSEKQEFRKFLYARAVHVLNVYRINLVHQAESFFLVEGYKELVTIGIISNLRK